MNSMDALMQLRIAIENFTDTLWGQSKGRIDERHLEPSPDKKLAEEHLAEVQDGITQHANWLRSMETKYSKEENLVILLARLEHISGWLDRSISLLGKLTIEESS